MRAELWKDPKGQLHLIEPGTMVNQKAERRETWAFIGTVFLNLSVDTKEVAEKNESKS